MRNVTHARFSILGLIAGSIFVVVGAWLLWSDRELLFRFIKVFAGFFLLMFGLGVLGASTRLR